MLVGHVKEPWMETPGNLVAHIRIGPSYHTRKEVETAVTCGEWMAKQIGPFLSLGCAQDSVVSL